MLVKAASPAAMAYAASLKMNEGGGFTSLLAQSLNAAADTGARADTLTAEAASGKRPDVVDVVTAVAESEAALETLVAVRDKVIQAYDEIMRMPI